MWSANEQKEALVDRYEVTRREKTKSFFSAIALALVVFYIAAPAVEAAVTRVRGTVTAKVKDSTGDVIESEIIGDMGVLQAEGSDGAIATRTYAGGGGFLGAGDCTAAAGQPADRLSNTLSVENRIVTGILLTGTGKLQITSNALPAAGVLSEFEVNAANPNFTATIPTGLTITSALNFTGVEGGNCKWVILGQ
jgi:hypothetical protein